MITAQSIQVGQAIIHPFNVGDLRADLTEWFGIKEYTGPDQFREEFEGFSPIPVQCFHIQHGETSLLVDAGVFDITPDSEYAIPGYEPPPSLVEQMSAAGIDINGVQHLVITHAHFDHFNGLTQRVDGALKPTFPNAQVYLGKADWESEIFQEALATPDSAEAATLGLLAELGRLTLVEGEMALADGIVICPSPGETPGHQSVSIESDGQMLHCIGDLYHHAVELVEPAWAVTWADHEGILASRADLQARIAGKDAVLVATHIAEVLQVGNG